MKNLKKVSRNELRTIKGGYKRCSDGCDLETEICCGGVCRIGIPNPNFPGILMCP
ncbi:bacteriocin-like protein [Chryseobacterium sp. MMS23-Vi53]|uniref:bacteriocin-like protein n=1 Tax=Chryseobacterium sp. MMS23-Vi53 TaxID=3386644 RepID=UPI0039E7FA96